MITEIKPDTNLFCAASPATKDRKAVQRSVLAGKHYGCVQSEKRIHIVSADPVKKGWSSDMKFRIVTEKGETCLLRLSDFASYDEKQKEFDIVRKFSALGFPMSQPLEFGVTENGSQVYMLLSWVEGADLSEILPQLPDEKQYQLGRKAGKILKAIHSLPLDQSDIPIITKKEKKLKQLTAYEQSGCRTAGDEKTVRYVRDNIGWIWREPPVYLHGDFHPGNLIYTPEGSVGVIDFNRCEIGDPYEEFYKLESFGREISIPFCIGQIDAYFQNQVPMEFWQTLAVYVAHASLFSIKWAEKFGQQEIAGMVKRYETALDDYDGFDAVIPKWYHR